MRLHHDRSTFTISFDRTHQALERDLWELERNRPWRKRYSFPGIPSDSFTGIGVDKLDPVGPFAHMRKQHLEIFSKVRGEPQKK